MEVFTKSAPAAFDSVLAVTFSSSVSSAASMITLLITPQGRQASVTATMSRSTVRRSPDLRAPMLITMSTSAAPSKITRRVSYCLTSAVVAPSGKPTTVQTPTPLPRSSRAQSATQAGLTQTVAKWNSAASRQSFSISARVASGFRRVWSIMPAMLAGAPPAAWTPRRAAPASITDRSRSGQQSCTTAWQAQREEDGRSPCAAITSSVMISTSRWRSWGFNTYRPPSRPARSSSRRIFASRLM